MGNNEKGKLCIYRIPKDVDYGGSGEKGEKEDQERGERGETGRKPSWKRGNDARQKNVTKKKGQKIH